MEKNIGVVERGDRPRFVSESPHAIFVARDSFGKILIATSRPSLVSRARYTSPIPPASIGASICMVYMIRRNWHELDSLPMIEKAKSRAHLPGLFLEPRVSTYDFRALASDRVALSRRAERGPQAREQYLAEACGGDDIRRIADAHGSGELAPGCGKSFCNMRRLAIPATVAAQTNRMDSSPRFTYCDAIPPSMRG